MREDCSVLTRDTFYKSNEQRIYQSRNNRSNLRKKIIRTKQSKLQNLRMSA
jgi:hypothetical protein